VAGYRDAWLEWKQGLRDVLFPAGTYAMVRHAGVMCASPYALVTSYIIQREHFRKGGGHLYLRLRAVSIKHPTKTLFVDHQPRNGRASTRIVAIRGP